MNLKDKKRNDDAFLKAYSNLNEEQKEAVDMIEGPVMVVAGPGTGKTQILTLRIANILRQTDTRPENILALTFTESGVRAMRQRLTSFIGEDSYHVPIHTFHSFAGELIRNYPDSYKNIVGGRPASDLEKYTILENILDEKIFKRVRPSGNPRLYVRPILNAITELKRENISIDDFAKSIDQQIDRLNGIEKVHEKGAHKGKVRGEYLEAEKKLERNQELLYVYQRFVLQMRALRLYDFEDMILDTIEALKSNEEMLLDVQERFQYILADEHQDVNKSQNLLVETIASYHENPNVFVVGDEKQAIFRFQGASLENFLFFDNAYPSVKTISLTNNYRSDQKILDIAHDCILTDDPHLQNLRIPLEAQNTFSTIITQQSFSQRVIEDAWVIDQIKAHHEAGVPWQEITVIVRTNREIEQLTSLMRKADIPVLPSSDNDILNHPIFLSIKNLIRLVAEVNNEVIISEIIQSPYFEINNEDLIKVFLSRNFNNPLSAMVYDEAKLINSGVKETAPFLRIGKLIKEARELELTKTPAEVVEFLLRESGLIDYVLKNNLYDGIKVIRRFYDEIELLYRNKEIQNLKTILDKIVLYEEYGIPLTVQSLELTKEAVNLLTAHKAKGLEFEVVILPHLTDNSWGGSVRSSLFDLPIAKQIIIDEKAQAEDDERRLFYVAVTRAKRVLLCSYANKNEEGRDLSPSRFLVGLESGMIEEIDITEYEKMFKPLESLNLTVDTKINIDFLRLTLENKGWSATSFNNYCKSPWEYLYKNVLKIPTVKTPELHFGTAIHAVLEEVVRLWGVGQTVTDSKLKELLDVELTKSALTTVEFTRNHERGFNALLAYLPQLQSSLGHTFKTEYSVKAVLETGIPEFPEVTLTGNFDRLDFDKEGRVIRVIDYKTGKTKTRGEIEGKTKNSDGRYKRQLVFYALLLSLHPDTNFHSLNGVLSFVEPDSKGKLHEEEFSVTEDEVNDLRQQIIEATKAVVTGECLTVSCDEKVCEYCHLVDLFVKK